MKLNLVTTNDGKFREFASGLSLAGVELERVNRQYPEIQANSLEDVVLFGAEWLRGGIDCDFLIDDSGLFIDSLGGFPGVYSSFVERTIGLSGILRLLQGHQDRKATFKTVLGLCIDGTVKTISGECRGHIATEARGSGGFGYDPIFVPEGESRTFAEMGTEEKNAISHRGVALIKLRKFLQSTDGGD